MGFAISAALPVINDCQGCGACCLEQQSPPGYLAIMQLGCESWTDDEDVERFKSLPAEALRELSDYRDELLLGAERRDDVCIWFDKQSRRCRHYEHRPNICRW